MPFRNLFAAPWLDDRSRGMRKQGGGTARGLALAAALITALFASAAGSVTLGSGFSAMWYDPARSGEGLQLEILDTDLALVEWFTYNEQGGQRWFQGVGQIVHGASGDSINFPQLYVTRGGRFGPAFNPGEVVLQVAGDATLSFSDCNTGSFHYAAFGQSQTLPVQRLTQTMGAGCTPINGVPGQPVMAYAGQSGSWFDVAHSGEGFELQWLTNNQALVIWYTYDTQGNQVWLLGVGIEQDGAIVFEHVDRPRGPHFGTAFDPASLQHEDWGTLTLQLDCAGGTAHYVSSQSEFGAGDLALTRLTKLKKPDCPTVAPKLSDLYHITWDEIPIEPWTDANPTFHSAESIAQNGTIAGQKNRHLVLWHPDTRTWEDASSRLINGAIEISSDGSAVIASDDDSDLTQPAHTLKWQRSTGWQALPGDVISQSYNEGVSRNFNYVIGYGHGPDAYGYRYAWIRAINGVQRLLPNFQDIFVGHPHAVSNDGNTIVGEAPTPLMGADVFSPLLIAVRWDNGGQPTIIRNPDGEELETASVCNVDCSIIFGDGLYNNPNHPHSMEAWYLKSEGAFGYLGVLPDADSSYYVAAATLDGSLAVGTYHTNQDMNGPNSAVSSYRPFVWTQATGIVSVRSLISELGIGDDNWDWVAAASVSPDGRKILLNGTTHGPVQPHQVQVPSGRAVVVQLVPKSAAD